MQLSRAPTTYLRLALACATGLAWLLLLGGALHRSGEPSLLGRYSAGHAALLACGLVACALLTLANLRSFRARVVAWRRELLLVPLSIGITLLGAELLLRIFDPIGIAYYSEMRRYEQDRIPDPVLSYRNPSSTTRRYQGVELRYNEAGLRDDSIAPKAEREFRVLVLGDSVALGWGVAQEQTFSAVLQRRLTAELGRPVRVINTGVCSYNTVMEVAWLHEHGFALAPDLVLLLYVPNDVPIKSAIWAPGASGNPDHPVLDFVMTKLARSWLFRLLLHLESRRGARSVPVDPGDPGWQASMAALRELVADTRARGVGVAVFFWTLAGAGDPAQTALLAAVRSATAPVVVDETGSWFTDAPPGSWMNSRIDPHPNELAHGRLAERMHASLRERHLLP